MKFSANLGFLWTDRSLPDAVRAAAAAGFDAVELHWPYDTPVQDLRAALDETGLPVLGLNTSRGDVSAGENGLSALPDREAEARAAIDQALEYATHIGAANVHVMAGNARGSAARDMFLKNLSYAADCAADLGLTILIEPLNDADASGYHFHTTVEAEDILSNVQKPNVKLMFDCYHAGRMGEDVLARVAELMPLIGHVQIASVPDRGAPDHGTLAYDAVFAKLRTLGWATPLGAEYKPVGDTDASLVWLKAKKDSS